MIGHSTSRVALLGAIMMLSLGANAAKVYKWTDANGQTHFSSTPPPDQSAEQVQMRGSADVAAPEEPADPAAATPPAGDKPELSPEQREQLTKYCVEIRERINTLGQSGKVMERRPDGTEVELSPVDVADRVRQDKENERNYCKANGL